MKFWIGTALVLLGFGCILTAVIWQQVLCYQMFGIVFNTDKFFIPHWSALLYLGAIPMIAGQCMINFN